MIVLRYLVFNILLMLSALSQAAVSLNNSTWDMIGPYSDRSLGYIVLKEDGNFFSFKKSISALNSLTALGNMKKVSSS